MSNHTTNKKRLRHLNNLIEAFISRSEYEKKLTSPTILCELTVANGEGLGSENFQKDYLKENTTPPYSRMD